MKARKILFALWYFTDVVVAGTPFLRANLIQPLTGQNLHIKALQVELAPATYQQILRNLAHNNVSVAGFRLASSVDLGMNDVPVLNQGVHGSYVTFAVTAALDAAMKRGDYISQLCQLQLGKYLQTFGYISSVWDGGLGSEVLTQIEQFGFMPKTLQREHGCGGLKEYPLIENDTSAEMRLEDFHQYSQSLQSHHIEWANIVDAKHFNNSDYQASNLINQIKESLNQGDRVLFGVLLMDYEKGLIGAVGSHKVFNDTWIITPEIIQDIKSNPQFAAHEMIIIGYDDQAVARDDHERLHQGLFKLRNSWGDKLGDQGDFYMSYDYLKAMIVDAQRIKSRPPHVQ